MVRHWFGKKKDEQAVERRASVPADHLVCAIGDVHGRLDLLTVLMEKIETVAARSECRQRSLVFLGDYIDRGPDSAKLIDRLLNGFPGFETIFIRGNHDETLVQFLRDPTVGPIWTNFGGTETLQSYGLVLKNYGSWPEVRSAFLAALPDTHAQFFKELKLHVQIGDYLFVHAGLRPYVPLAQQSREDLMWIRDEFLDSDAHFGPIIVHGHTPSDVPEEKHNRIGIDTGAYMSGKLTALVLEGRNRQFLSTPGFG